MTPSRGAGRIWNTSSTGRVILWKKKHPSIVNSFSRGLRNQNKNGEKIILCRGGWVKIWLLKKIHISLHCQAVKYQQILKIYSRSIKNSAYMYIYIYQKIAKHFLEVTVYHKSISNFCKVNQNKVSFCGKIGSIILMDYTRSISCMLQIAVLQNHLRGIYTILPTIKITWSF